jgi:LytS/YehU family sensor histidine kinase
VKRSSWIATICGAALLFFAAAAPVSACPMCKLASESASRQPRAYMYSVLFMMSMPMIITGGFGIAFYRLSRQANRMREEELRAFQEANETAPENEGD